MGSQLEIRGFSHSKKSLSGFWPKNWVEDISFMDMVNTRKESFENREESQ